MNMKKILVAVDFSDESQVAVEQGLAIARQQGAELTLLYVGVAADQPVGIPTDAHDATTEYMRIVEEFVAGERRQLDEHVARISGQGVKVSSAMLDGVPARRIPVAATDLSADLVITGTHGRTGIKRVFLGSVAERIVRHCTTDVLVARPRAKERGLERILVATDFSDISEHALETAVALASPGAVIDVLHCWYLAPLSYPYYAPTRSAAELAVSLRDSIAGDAARRGAKLIARHQNAGCTLHFHNTEATPVQGIQDWLDEHEYDLVVTGSHGRRGASRFLLGSVAELTVRHAPCSVLVAHAPPAVKSQ